LVYLAAAVEGALEAGLCKGELVDEEGDSVCGCRCVDRRWVLRWEEAVNGTPIAAAVWLDGGKSKSLRERGSRVKKEMGRWVSGRRRWDAVWLWLLCFV
jgi:hypothetical protein